MTSPPRRMTRARAKKEGYEPDWRINPHWKTPKRPKAKKTRLLFQEGDNNLENNVVHQSSVSEVAQRVPSPVKIRIAAKLPPLPQIAKPSIQSLTTSESDETASIAESARKSVNLGSPVRVRPRTEINYNTTADKENSSAAMLAAWTTSGKSTIPTTPAPVSRSRPLEASPSSINTHGQPTTIKVLSTPIRILNPQTPSRIIGSARRIPVKAEKTKPLIYKLDPISDVSCPESHRDFSYRVNQRPQSPTKLVSSGKGLVSPVKPLQSHAQRPLSNETKPLDLSEPANVNTLRTVSTQKPKSWVQLKTAPTLPRPNSSFRNPSTRPVKTSPKEPPPRPVTKRDFYVDEISVPLQLDPKSVQRASTPVPKFPIRRRSISQSSSPTDKVTPKARITSNPVHFDSLEELRPVTKLEKWKAPMKGAIHTPTQSVRKVCFRTPSMDTPAKQTGESQPLRKSLSILNLSTPKHLESEVSTTPSDTPHSPPSPKVFSLSDAEGSSFELFTPRKPRTATIQPLQTSVELPINVQPTEQQKGNLLVVKDAPFGISTPKPIAIRTDAQTPKLHDVIVVQPIPSIRKGPARDSSCPQDIFVPIKDADMEIPIVTPKPTSVTSSVKSTRNDKEIKGPLNGVIAFVDVKTADGVDASGPFVDSLKNMGARVVKQWTWNGEEMDKVGITHVIYKQGGPRTLSKVKCAKGAVKCVGLAWVSRYFSLSTD
jgi:hypothetical protein